MQNSPRVTSRVGQISLQNRRGQPGLTLDWVFHAFIVITHEQQELLALAADRAFVAEKRVVAARVWQRQHGASLLSGVDASECVGKACLSLRFDVEAKQQVLVA